MLQFKYGTIITKYRPSLYKYKLYITSHVQGSIIFKQTSVSKFTWLASATPPVYSCPSCDRTDHLSDVLVCKLAPLNRTASVHSLSPRSDVYCSGQLHRNQEAVCWGEGLRNGYAGPSERLICWTEVMTRCGDRRHLEPLSCLPPGKWAWACAPDVRLESLCGPSGLCAGQAALLTHPLEGPDIPSSEAGPEYAAYHMLGHSEPVSTRLWLPWGHGITCTKF